MPIASQSRLPRVNLLARFVIACCCLLGGGCLAAEDAPRQSPPLQVEVLIGDPRPAPPAKPEPGLLNTPFAVAFEPSGAMWIVEYDGGRLLRRETDGTLTHVAGDGTLGYADGSAKLAQFNKLHNVLRLDDGRLLMSDHLNHAIRCYDPKTDLVTSLAGNGRAGFKGDNGPFAAAEFNEPICLELGSQPDKVLVADIRNRRLRELDLTNETIRTVAGNGAKGVPDDGAAAVNSPLFDPRAAIADSRGNIFLLERSGNALRQITPQGNIRTLAGSGEKGTQDGIGKQAAMNGPKHLCFGPHDTIFIADDVNHRIRQYDQTTRALSTVNLGDYRLNRPHGVAVRDGWLYIADSFNHRLLRAKLP